MKVYVAARFFDKEVVRAAYKSLADNGHEITADWTVHRNIKPYDENPEIAKEYAVEDIDGVKNSDIFILLTSEEVGSGSSSELGAAIASHLLVGKPKIYVVGKHMGKNVCFFHPSVDKRETLEEVLEELNRGETEDCSTV